MDISLAGINIDTILLDRIKNALGEDAEALTPETLSASYARISRSQRTVKELREKSIKEVGKARRSNERIIFEMGHASVAEHAVFNFDILNVSRYAVEFIESFRLASFTEKSQRYVLFKEQYKIPEEIAGGRYKFEYVSTIHKLAVIYSEIYEKLIKKDIKEESAKEDSRYATSLATLTQLGMTINARNLEYMIVRLKNSPLIELKDFAAKIYRSVENIVPSLVKYVNEDPYYRNYYSRGISSEDEGIPFKSTISPDAAPSHDAPSYTAPSYTVPSYTAPVVKLINYDKDGEDKILAAILYRNGVNNFARYKALLKGKSNEYRYRILKPVFDKMKVFHPVPREFEYADMLFEVECSASAFAQLKRHRMSVQTAQDYNPDIGYTVPPTIKTAGLEALIEEAYSISTELFHKLYSENRSAAPYILTNAHRKRVLVKLDLREIYHIARLREDIHAQWEIRKIAEKMVAYAKGKYPLAALMACGKDKFESAKDKLT